MAAPSAPALCDVCPGAESNRRRPEATRTYTDVYGFVYGVCERHYASLLTGLQQAIRNRTQRTTAVPSLPRLSPRSRPGRDKRAPGARATAAEQRRAREAMGWSLRQLSRELGVSYSQLQSAETGRRRVDPEVAAWVRGVLDVPRGTLAPCARAEAQIREALTDALAAKAEEEARR